MNKIIVGMGEALWDVLPEGKKIGGAPANFAYHVSQFGFDSRVVSAVGRDADGQEILDVFAQKKLTCEIEQVDYPTGTVQVTLDAVGVPCYEIKEGVAWDNIPFTDDLKRLALSTRAVCFGSLAQRSPVSRATIQRFLDTMPDGEDQIKIFDINLRQGFYTKEILCESMRRCNILKINDEELVTISRIFGYPGIDLQDKCWILLAKYNLKMLILGYKHLRRGDDFYSEDHENIVVKQNWLCENLADIIEKFKVVSFDNLAIDQLNVRRLMSDDEWNEFYMGDDGTMTYYIDMVERKFARSSTAAFDKRYDLLDSVDDMFQKILSE